MDSCDSADGETVAVGEPGHDWGGNDRAGRVRIWQWTGTVWTQLGPDIRGDFAVDQVGQAGVTLSADGLTVAIGIPGHDGSGDSSGEARIYQWTGSWWAGLPREIRGTRSNQNVGQSVALSADGQRLAVGVPGYLNSDGATWIYNFAPAASSFSVASDTVSITVTPANTATVINVNDNDVRTDDTTYSGDTTLVKTGGGTLILELPNSHTGGLRVEEGIVIIRNVAALNSGPLTIWAGATVLLDVGTELVALSSLSLDPAGQLDVGTAGITVAAGGFVEADIRQLLVSGCNNGAWDGASGIVHGSTESGRAIGYKVDANGVLTIRQTMAGDANMDGKVDFDDILALFPNYGTTSGMVWSGGDITYDDKVDFDDILALFPNYGGGSAFSNSVGGGGGTGTLAGMGGGGTGTSTGVGGSGGDSASTAPSGNATTTAPVTGPEPPAELGQQITVTLTRGTGGTTSNLEATSLAFAALAEESGVSKKTDDGGIDPGLSLGL